MRFTNDSQRRAAFANMTGRNSFANSSFLNLDLNKVKVRDPDVQPIPERVSSGFGVILPRRGTILIKEVDTDPETGRVIWTREIEEPLESTYVDLGVENKKVSEFIPSKPMIPLKTDIVDILKR
jgi:hypothetical protein